MAYGASLESWLGASPHGFESHILREHNRVSETLECETAGHFFLRIFWEAEGRRFFAIVMTNKGENLWIRSCLTLSTFGGFLPGRFRFCQW